MESKFKSFRELKIWQTGIEISKATYKITQNFPDSEKFGLTSQIRRSAVSIPSNIAEGWGRGYSKSFESFLKIARGSLAELETQIYISLELKYLQKSDYESIIALITEESKMLNSFINKLSQKENIS